MNILSNIKINQTDLKIIQKFKKNVLTEFPDAEFVLYGSKVKGTDEKFSDIDILIFLDRNITTKIEERIFEIGYEIELEYDVVLSIVIESKQFRSSPIAKAMPFYRNVNKEGVTI